MVRKKFLPNKNILFLILVELEVDNTSKEDAKN